MKQLVEDAELRTLRAMALGEKPFRVLRKWENLSALDLKEIKRLPARERLGLGYYTCARDRSAQGKRAA